MNPNPTSTNISTTLRPRNCRPASTDDEVNSSDQATPLPAISHNDSSTCTVLSSRTLSPIPSEHPSRPASRWIRDRSLSSGRPWDKQGTTAKHSTASASGTSLWETSWSSLQGIASNLLGGASNEGFSTRTPSPGKKRHLKVTHGRNSSAPPTQWGPSTGAERQLGKGSREERLAKVQAKKRETLSQANRGAPLNAPATFKRRISDAKSPKLGDVEDDGDALVYLHHVKTGDTLAGVMIKYNCQPAVFRKANRLWPNDSIQYRKTVVLPVDACGVKGRKIESVPSLQHFVDGPSETSKIPINEQIPWSESARSDPKATPLPSIPTSPSISVTGPEEPAWKHDSWVAIDGFEQAVEIARLPRRTLGFFPPARRKSLPYSDLDTPPASLDLPRPSFTSRSLRGSESRSSSGSQFAQQLQGPGGVGTLGKDVRNPGPAQDGLNKMFAAHLPNVAPRGSFESTHSNSSTGFEQVGGAIEGWVRKFATKAANTIHSPVRGGERGYGDLIELTNAFGIGEDEDHEGRDEGAVDMCTPHDDQERMLRERFPPRGRMFGDFVTRKGP